MIIGRYLLENSFVDGYSLEDGGGVLLLESNPSSGSINLFIKGIDNKNNDIDLFIHGHNSSNNNINLFINGNVSNNNVNNYLDLFINGQANNNNDIDLFIKGHDTNTNDCDLFIYGFASNNQDIDLFISGEDSHNNSTNLFIYGKDSLNNNINLFIGGRDSTANNKLYTGTSSNNLLRRSNEDGSNIITLVSSEDIRYIGIDQHDNLLFWSTFTGFRRSDLNGNNKTTISTSGFVPAFDVDDVNKKLYLAKSNGLFRCNYDFSSLELLIPVSGTSIAVDPVNTNSIYYSIQHPSSGNNIFRANLDGSNIESIFLTSDSGRVYSLEIDLIHSYLFLHNVNSDIIRKIDTAGNDLGIIGSGFPPISTLSQMSVEPFSDKLFAANSNNGIFLSGTNNNFQQITNINGFANSIYILPLDAISFSINGHEAETNDITLFIATKDSNNNDCDLFTHGHQLTNNDIDLFIHGKDQQTENLNLFIHGSNSHNENIDLSINGRILIADNVDLVIFGFDEVNNNITLFISSENVESDSINLFIHGSDRHTNDIDLFALGKIAESGQIDLTITGENTVNESIDLIVFGFNTHSNDLTLFIPGPALVSGNIDLFVSGFTDVLSSVSGNIPLIIGGIFIPTGIPCPILDPTASIQISDELIEIYQSRIDALINQLGKNVLLEFDPIIQPCTNCEFDTVRKKSTGIYKIGGPIPFDRGRKCPYCKGDGILQMSVTKCIKCLTKWNPKDAENYGIDVSNANDIVKLKTLLTDGDDLIRAKTAIVNYDIQNKLHLRTVLIKGPIINGLRESRYIITFWRLIGR